MQKLNILLDSNGVLFNSDAFISEYAVKYFKKKYNMDIVNPNGYGIKEIFNCSDEQEQEFWFKHAIKYLMMYKPRKDMVDAINKLRSEGNKVYNATLVRGSSKNSIINSCLKKTIVTLYKIGLKIHKVEFDGVEVFFTSDDNEKKCDVEKLNFIKEKDINLVVDDKRGNVLEFSKIPGLSVLCMDTTNNKDIEDENITRIFHGDHFYVESRKHEDKINNTASIFSTFVNLSTEEKKDLTIEQKKEYYQKYKEYLMQLPFDVETLKKGERNYKLMHATLGKALKCKWNPKIVNEQLMPKNTGIVIVLNHPCSKDSVLLLSTLKLPWHTLAKTELSKGAPGVAFNATYTVFVDRKNDASRKASLIEMGKILVHNGTMVIFAEGTNTCKLTSGNLGPFEGYSPFYLAQALDRDLLTMAITNKYGKDERPTVRIGDYTKIELDESLDDAKMRIWNNVNNLVEENIKADSVKALKR